MAEYITRIRTESGDLPIDYRSLANRPDYDTDIDNLNNQVANINSTIKTLQSGKVNNTITINGKPLTADVELSASDIDAAAEVHEHSTDSVTNGTFNADRIPVISMEKGGTNATSGQKGLENLLAAGAMILSEHQYGANLPNSGVEGQIFFKKVQ